MKLISYIIFCAGMLTIGLQGCTTRVDSISSHMESTATMTDMSISPALNMNLWKMLSTIEAQIPFTQQKIENLFKVSLTDTRKNTYFYNFKGGPTLLNDGTTIDNVIFSIKQDKTEPGDVRIEISS